VDEALIFQQLNYCGGEDMVGGYLVLQKLSYGKNQLVKQSELL
jgi:hypothetical protein